MKQLAPRTSTRLAGFTLIEMLIAGVICAVLLSAMFALLFGMLRLREKTYQAAEAGPPREQVIQIIRRDLMNAVSPNGQLAGAFMGSSGAQGSGGIAEGSTAAAAAQASGGTGTASGGSGLSSGGGLGLGNSSGEQASLEFYSTTGVLSDKEPWGEIQRIDYLLKAPALNDTKGGMDLVRKTTRNLLADSTPVEAEDKGQWTLLHGVQAMQLSYYDPDNTTWQTQWDSTQLSSKNPTAVKIHIDFVDDKAAKRSEPTLELVCPISAQPSAAASAAMGDTGQ